VTADDETRMNLAVHVVDRSGIARCLVIEAKFKAKLTRSQFGKYRRLLVDDYPEASSRDLFVVAPRRAHTISRALARKANKEGESVSQIAAVSRWPACWPYWVGSA
jgi:hypothetical protein